MTVICFSAFDKHSRFYLDIRSQLNKKRKVNLKVYSTYFSSFLYNLIRLKFSSWIPLKAWSRAFIKRGYYSELLKSSNTYKGISLEEVSKYHRALSPKANQKALSKQAMAYIDIIESIFIRLTPEAIICIGDTRMCIQIATLLARQKNIKVYFIEQGPFNRTFFNAQGVNANLVIDESNSPSGPRITESKPQKTEAYRRSPIYRLCDILLMNLFENSKIYPPDLRYTDVNSYKFPLKSQQIVTTSRNRFLLICQIPLDVNFIMHSPNFNSPAQILVQIHKSLPKDSDLVVREHPLFQGKYSPEFYDYIKNHNIIIENNSALKEALTSSDVVIVNNSTVGFEAICLYKPTVVLGNAFYDQDDLCLKIKNTNELTAVLKNALNFKPDKTAVEHYKHLLFSTTLLKGGIKDRELISSKTIANLIQPNL